MKLVNMLKRKLEDIQIAKKCNRCCLCCCKYKTVKEQNKECEVKKARGRMINREVRAAKNPIK